MPSWVSRLMILDGSPTEGGFSLLLMPNLALRRRRTRPLHLRSVANDS